MRLIRERTVPERAPMKTENCGTSSKFKVQSYMLVRCDRHLTLPKSLPTLHRSPGGARFPRDRAGEFFDLRQWN
jgi:hypothetical protein